MTPRPNSYKPEVAYVDYGAYLHRERPDWRARLILAGMWLMFMGILEVWAVIMGGVTW